MPGKSRGRPMIHDWVPVDDYLTEDVRLLDDGSVWASYEVEGVGADTADAEQIMRGVYELNQLFRNIADNRLLLKVKLGRGLASPASWPKQECSIPFLEDLIHTNRDNLLDGSLYENRIFVTLEYRPAKVGGEWVSKKMAQHGPRADETVQERVDVLNRACSQAEASLKAYGLRRLGMAERRGSMKDEMLEAEHFIQTGEWQEIGVTRGRPGDTLFSEDVTVHHEHIEIRGPGATTYAAHLAFKEAPAQTWPGVLGALLAAPIRFSLVQSFAFMEQAEGQRVLDRKQNKMVWANDKAAKQIKDLEIAAGNLLSGEFVMGTHSLTLCVFASRAGTGSALYDTLVRRGREAILRANLPERAATVFESAIQAVIGRPDSNPLSDVVNAAWKMLGSCGCVVARENKALLGAWLSMLPGNDRFAVRPGAITSLNFIDMNPLHNYTKGPAQSRWGDPICITVSPGGTAHRFHWHDGTSDSAVGNTLVTGETGSGKTTGTGYLIANTVARIHPMGGGWIGLDHKRGWNALTLAMGGSYSILGDSEPSFAPMKALPNTARTREFLTDLLRGCIQQGGWRDLTPEEDYRLALGIDTVMQNEREDRWVREVQAFLGNDPDGAGARLRKWCWGEELGWVLDAPADHIDMTGDINCHDTTRLMANQRARGPAMLYLFFCVEQRLNGRPLLITVDEGWDVVMADTVFSRAIEKIARTIRSKNGVLVFLTQSLGDPVRMGLAHALVEQFPNQHHYANLRARREDFRALQRTDGEYDALMTLQKGTGSFLLCKGSTSSIQSTPLHGMEGAIAILSASEANLEAIDAMSAEDRADPVRFQHEFHRLRKMIVARHRRQRQRTPEHAE